MFTVITIIDFDAFYNNWFCNNGNWFVDNWFEICIQNVIDFQHPDSYINSDQNLTFSDEKLKNEGFWNYEIKKFKIV